MSKGFRIEPTCKDLLHAYTKAIIIARVPARKLPCSHADFEWAPRLSPAISKEYMQTISVVCPLAVYSCVVDKIGHFAKPSGLSNPGENHLKLN